jgi:hypothetical protein
MFDLVMEALWKVALYGFILGAGLPVIFAVGVRFLAIGSTETSDEPTASGAATVDVRRSPIGVLMAAICFLIVVAGVAVGITYIVAAGKGEQLNFDHVYPTIVPKS